MVTLLVAVAGPLSRSNALTDAMSKENSAVIKDQLTKAINDPKVVKYVCDHAKTAKEGVDEEHEVKAICEDVQARNDAANKSPLYNVIKTMIPSGGVMLANALSNPEVCKAVFTATGQGLADFVKTKCPKKSSVFGKW